MDPSQPYQGAPAEWHSRGISGDVPVNSAEPGPADPFKVPFRQSAGASIPTPPAPEPDVHYQPQYRPIVPAPTGSFDGGHPPTPPRHEGDSQYGQLQQWYYSQPPRVPSAPTQPQYAHSSFVSPIIPVWATTEKVFSQPQYHAAGGPPRLHPSANLLHSSPPQPQINRPPPLSLSPASPSIQQWPTHNLKIDEKTRKKQEVYREKGEAKRRQSFTSQSPVAPQYVPVQKSATTPRKKRKTGFTNMVGPPIPPPPLLAYQQPVQVPGYHPLPQQEYMSMDWPGYTQHPGMVMSYPSAHAPQTEIPRQAPPPKPPNPEQAYQPITDQYEAYKWPVMLYELNPQQKKYDFAQTFLESLLDKNIYNADQFRWHAHTVEGFIKNGDRHSIIVLHNAANPFSWGIEPVKTSTTIGVYGRFAHLHNEIRWTTIAPSIPRLFQSLVEKKYIRVKMKWAPDMKASEKRFHRAYWLAANMLPLKGLLNHNREPEPVHDAPDEDEEDVEFSESDLQTGWDGEEVDEERSARVWQRLVDEVDGYEVEQLGGEYTHIGGSERVHSLQE